MDAREIWIRLNAVSKLPTDKAIQIANNLQTLNHVSYSQLKNYGLSEQQSAQFMRLHADAVNRTLKWLDINESSLLTIVDSDYPLLLKQIYNPPLLLFVAGNRSCLNSTQIALIGSRNATEYGIKWATYFAQELAKQGITITSGLAQGIDGVGHRGVLKQHGTTIAVLGSGLEHIYPTSHRTLAEEIKGSGALVSEYLPHTAPFARHFPQRNRIISGLSTALLIIEAGIKSGSLITANYALQQGKELFVLPGLLGNSHFEGNHQLIKQGANLVSSLDDIAEYLNSSLHWLSLSKCDDHQLPLIPPTKQNNKDEEKSVMSAVQKQAIECILPFISFEDACPVDIITNRSGLSTSELAPLLLELELIDKISMTAGGYIRME